MSKNFWQHQDEMRKLEEIRKEIEYGNMGSNNRPVGFNWFDVWAWLKNFTVSHS